MSDNFQLYSKYYNLLYKDKDYDSEADYVTGHLRLLAPKAKSILEFGSGTGIHGLHLQKKGYSVFGLERSEGMVEQAKMNGLNCMVADIKDFKLDTRFDAVVSLFHVISYLNNNDDLLRCFKNAFDHLNDRGIFLFDVWYSPAVYHLKASPRIKRMQDADLKVIRFAEPEVFIERNVINVHYSIFATDLQTNETAELTEDHPMRHFSSPEIALLAQQTGFKVLNAEEFLTGNEPSENTWGVCFILQKK